MANRARAMRKSPGSPSANRATVAAGFVTGLLSGLDARGIDRREILVQVGIDRTVISDPGFRIPLQAYADLYGAVIRVLDDEGFALFASPLRPGTFEFMCRAAVGSATLGEALARAAKVADDPATFARHLAAAKLLAEQVTDTGEKRLLDWA